MGLAARLAARMYVFERGCFTTAGLDTVMQVINMGQTTQSAKSCGMATESIVLVENMSINQEIPNETLISDLLSEEDGDETTNHVRALIKSKFQIEFCKLPFCQGKNDKLHSEICKEMCEAMLENLIPFQVGSVNVDGMLVIQMVNELISQIRGGGARFNMVTATEALVSNMSAEAANTIWYALLTYRQEFVEKIRKVGNHPIQITGRKHLRTIIREVENISTTSYAELESIFKF